MLKLRILTAALACLLLAGCSTKSLVYNQLDWLIPWFVDDYVELDEAQSTYLDQQLAPFLKWHREEELTRYIAFLSQVESDLDSEVKPETIHQWVDETMLALERSQQRLTEIGINIVEHFDDEQIAMLKQSLLDKQAELEDEYLPRNDAEYAEDTCERLEERLDDYMGTVNRAQETLLQDACSQLVRFDRAWLQDRRNWLDGLLPLLDRKAGWQEQIREQMDLRFNNSNVAYNEALSHNLAIITTAVARVLNQREGRQQTHLSAELASLRDDLKTLNVRVAEETPESGRPPSRSTGFNPFSSG